MLKKTILFVIFIFATSCGYQSIYLKKNDNNFFIKEIKLEGDKKIGKILTTQIIIEKNKTKKIPYTLILNSRKLINLVTRDSFGNPAIYRVIIEIRATLEKDKIKIKEKSFNKTFTYNSIKNKFDQSEYVKNIEQNLIDKIAEELIIFLYY